MMLYGSEVGWRRDLDALRERDFALLFAGRGFSGLGDAIGPVAITFAVLDIGGAGDLGIVLGGTAVGLVAFLLVAGVWADRVSRRLLVLAADLLRLASGTVSAALVLSGDARIWQLAVAGIVFGAGEAIFMPASTALVPETVTRQNLQSANALLGLTRAATMIIGPAVAGVLVATAGPGAALAAHAGCYLVSAAFLLPMRTRSAPATVRAGFLNELRAGFTEVRSRRWLWTSILAFTVFTTIAYPAFMIAGPVIAKESLGGPGAWAAILTASSIGAFAGSIIALRIRPRRPLLVCWLVCLMEPPQFIVLGMEAPLVSIAAVALAAGVTLPVFETLWTTTIQREVPPDALGRVTSYDYFGSLVTAPIGYALIGPVVALIGAPALLYVSAILVFAITAAMLLVPEVRSLQGPGRAVVG